MRGENICMKLTIIFIDGTSPRARGKLVPARHGYSWGRNIPACAGKTVRNDGGACRSSEHPRVRGENLNTDAHVTNVTGTSPRARGKLPPQPQFSPHRRNIPACAGKTQLFCQTVTALLGTSPRARGKHKLFPIFPAKVRNIPACAGKTPRLGLLEPQIQEHPRVRGEN